MQVQEDLSMSERRRSTDKDLDTFMTLHNMLAQVEWMSIRNELPYANDLSMKLGRLTQAIEACMEECNIGEDA